MDQIEKRVNSVGLYDEIAIETWLFIADCVQKLNFTDGNDKEFYENLKMLKKYLVGTEVSLEEEDRYATFFMNVGLSTLLQSIYDIKTKNNKKEHFAEQIYALDDLGIRKIDFIGNTSQNITSIEDISESHDYPEKDILFLHKALTDGSFYIENIGRYSHIYRMTNLEDINYILYLVLSIKKGRDLILRFLIDSKATLMNFDGILPNKKSIMEMHQPHIRDNSDIYEWKVTNENRVKQQYEPYVKKKR